MRILFVFLIVCISSGVIAQRASIRHVEGIRSVDVSYGITKYGSLFSTGFVMYFSNKLYGKGQVFYWSGENKGVKLSSIGVDVYGAYSPFNIRETVFFNLNGGLTVANDAPIGKIEGNLQLPNQLKFGLLGGMDMEVFITDRFVTVFTFNEKFLSKKENYGQSRYFAQISLRYNL